MANTSSPTIGFSGMLGVAFIVLKLCGVIEWPWLWVLAPLWSPLVFLLCILVVYYGMKGYEKRKRRQILEQIRQRRV